MRTVVCDVLVVGGGSAALRAAIAAKETDPALRVVLATKGRLGKSGVTANAFSDRMAFHAVLPHTAPGGKDAWRRHAEDIYRIGGMVSDVRLAEVLAKGGREAFEYLDALGVPFVKKDGLADQFVTDGSEFARACYTGPRTAAHIEAALLGRLRGLPLDVFEHTAAEKLVVKDGRVAGAIALDTKTGGELFAFCAPAVVLATGGAGLIYESSVFPAGMTGDGYAMAYEAGARLVNMEFIQIGMASTKTRFNCSGSMMRAVPAIVNEAGEEFLERHIGGLGAAGLADLVFEKGASWPVAYEKRTRAIDVAVYRERKSGRRVYLDYSRNPKGFSFDALRPDARSRYMSEIRMDAGPLARGCSPLSRLSEINPDALRWFLGRGIDLAKGEPIEVAECAQHFQGGVKIDEQARTTVAGLWAAGEAAGGQHGANRPGGNALLDCQVMGRIAGTNAARAASSKAGREERAVERELRAFARHAEKPGSGRTGAATLRRSVRRIMDGAASVVRTEEGLADGLERVRALSRLSPSADEKGLSFLLETRAMLTVSEMVLSACSLRDESRGPHLRFESADAAEPVARDDSRWCRYITIERGEDGMKLEAREPKGPTDR